MRITSKGQVTIPQAVREQAGLMPGTDVDFIVDKGGVRLVKTTRAKSKRKTAGQRLVERLRGSGDGKLTTDQIMAMTRGPIADDE